MTISRTVACYIFCWINQISSGILGSKLAVIINHDLHHIFGVSIGSFCFRRVCGWVDVGLTGNLKRILDPTWGQYKQVRNVNYSSFFSDSFPTIPLLPQYTHFKCVKKSWNNNKCTQMIVVSFVTKSKRLRHGGIFTIPNMVIIAKLSQSFKFNLRLR